MELNRAATSSINIFKKQQHEQRQEVPHEKSALALTRERLDQKPRLLFIKKRGLLKQNIDNKISARKQAKDDDDLSDGLSSLVH